MDRKDKLNPLTTITGLSDSFHAPSEMITIGECNCCGFVFGYAGDGDCPMCLYADNRKIVAANHALIDTQGTLRNKIDELEGLSGRSDVARKLLQAQVWELKLLLDSTRSKLDIESQLRPWSRLWRWLRGKRVAL